MTVRQLKITMYSFFAAILLIGITWVLWSRFGSMVINAVAVPQEKGVVEGQVSIGPICPVERIDKPCPVSPEMYASKEVVAHKGETGAEVAESGLSADGAYKLELLPGTYTIKVENSNRASAFGVGFAAPKNGASNVIKVESGKTIKLDFDIDTGIR